MRIDQSDYDEAGPLYPEECYIELPKDEYGNTLYPYCVMSGVLQDAATLVIHEPEEIARSWPTISMRLGIVPCQGPARLLTLEEHQEIVSEIQALSGREDSCHSS